MRSQAFEGPDGHLQIFLFSSAELARRRAGAVDAGGYSIGRDGSVLNVEWTAPPHWFRTGSSIVLYLGSRERVLRALRAIAGAQFAGA